MCYPQLTFVDQVDYFFGTFQLEGWCYSENDLRWKYEADHIGDSETVPMCIFYTTDFARKCREKQFKDGGFYLALPDKKIKRYFSKYTDDRLFAIMFGLWLGFSEEQIHEYESKDKKIDVFNLLYYHVCLSEGQTVCDRVNCQYEGNYYVADPHEQFDPDNVLQYTHFRPARVTGNRLELEKVGISFTELVVEDTGERLFANL